MSDAPELIDRSIRAENRYFATMCDRLVAAGEGGYDYHWLDCRFDAVVVVPVLADGRLLVERIWRAPYRSWFWEFPAGGIEPGEAPVAAAARELAEETAHAAGELRDLGSFEALPGLQRMRLHLVAALGCRPQGDTALEPLEILSVHALSVAEAWTKLAEPPVSSFLAWGLQAAAVAGCIAGPRPG